MIFGGAVGIGLSAEGEIVGCSVSVGIVSVALQAGHGKIKPAPAFSTSRGCSQLGHLKAIMPASDSDRAYNAFGWSAREKSIQRKVQGGAAFARV